ncbi:hypothetical protein HanPI659440_Chr17g0677441 [Helianthus annuus]|nr:hypothetical protein HanPI659440_Chr17g0677441 [Helianthus annuus]
MDRLFVSCGLAQVVWDYMSRWYKLPPVYVFCINDLVNMHRHLRGSHKWKKSGVYDHANSDLAYLEVSK